MREIVTRHLTPPPALVLLLVLPAAFHFAAFSHGPNCAGGGVDPNGDAP
jgi:hypothetical protein